MLTWLVGLRLPLVGINFHFLVILLFFDFNFQILCLVFLTFFSLFQGHIEKQDIYLLTSFFPLILFHSYLVSFILFSFFLASSCGYRLSSHWQTSSGSSFQVAIHRWWSLGSRLCTACHVLHWSSRCWPSSQQLELVFAGTTMTFGQALVSPSFLCWCLILVLVWWIHCL